MEKSITVRPVQRCDLEALVKIEVRAWKRRGIPALKLEELEAWCGERSPLFLVAESEGELCGYYFGRLIRFSLKDANSFLEPAKTGWEWDRHPHEPGANSAYGICVASTVLGAGSALNVAVHDLLALHRIRYFIGISRLAGLDRFMQKIENGSDEAALWYAHASAILLDMPVWSVCPPMPKLSWSLPRRPDPVLAFHVAGTAFGLVGVLPNYMPDPASRNYGAVILSEFPHRR